MARACWCSQRKPRRRPVFGSGRWPVRPVDGSRHGRARADCRSSDSAPCATGRPSPGCRSARRPPSRAPVATCGLGVSAGRAPGSGGRAWRLSSRGCAGSPSRPAALLAVAAGSRSPARCHEDGLADTADGFGGGADRDAEARDHARQPARHVRHAGAGAQHRVARRGARRDRRPDPCRPGADRGACRLARRLAGADAAAGAGASRRARRRRPADRPVPVAIAAAAIGGVIALTVLGPVRRHRRALLLTAAALRSRQCLRAGRSAATPATFSAFSSKSERS